MAHGTTEDAGSDGSYYIRREIDAKSYLSY